MSLTTIVGAFLALVPGRPARADKEDPRFIAGYDAGLKDGRLEAKELEREVERLERELAAERNLSTHWRDEAARLASENRQHRAYQVAYARQAQQAQQAQQNHLSQLGEPLQYAQQNSLWCNCVPSRAQVWGAQHGLVQQLNDNGRE